MTKRAKPEILAPAGSMEGLKAAIAAGCNAVYIGGNRFGARAFANNLDQDEMLEAIAYCHLHDVKLYMTVNTVLKDREIKEALFSYLRPYYEAGLDAVIVQDMGVLRFISRHFPKLAIHASTQMTLTMGKGKEFLEKYHVNRIVPARELTLRELCTMRRETSMELEVFVHGALCYCYSGQCLFSSMLGGRSGNRGRCAQPCRLPYHMAEQNRSEDAYLLSPKELCNLPYLAEMIEAGIDSFKIEGRMKRTEYTAFVTSMYRKYVDLYFALGKEKYRDYIKKNQKEWEEDLQNLSDLYNREGFTQGYLTGQIGDKQQYLDDMKLLEYDILYGKHDIYEGNSPFQATNLHMGIDPIEVTKVVYEEPDLLIFGENFNEYSKVFLGDKQLETTYVWPELILVRDVARDTYRKEKDTLSVKQVGKDKVPLGEAQIRLP